MCLSYVVREGLWSCRLDSAFSSVKKPPTKIFHKDNKEKSQIYAEAWESGRHTFCQKYHIVNAGFQLNFPKALVKFPDINGRIWNSWGQDSISFSVLFLLWIASTFWILTKHGTFPPSGHCRPNTVTLSLGSAFLQKRCWIYSCTIMPLLWMYKSHLLKSETISTISLHISINPF